MYKSYRNPPARGAYAEQMRQERMPDAADKWLKKHEGKCKFCGNLARKGKTTCRPCKDK